MEKFTDTFEIKTIMTNEQKVALLEQISAADNIISEAAAQLEKDKEEFDAKKEAFKELKEKQDDIISQCLADYRYGYTIEKRKCFVTYSGNLATYTDALTGEILEKREMTSDEQLRLSSNRIDAEHIIRESSEEED